MPGKPTGAALHNACYAGDGKRAEALVALGADVHYISKANRQTPLHQACIQGLEQAAVLMVRAGARLDVRDYYNRTPLEAARDLGHPELVAPLLAEAHTVGLDQLVIGATNDTTGGGRRKSSDVLANCPDTFWARRRSIRRAMPSSTTPVARLCDSSSARCRTRGIARRARPPTAG